jgi:maleamate amidohydrolase
VRATVVDGMSHGFRAVVPIEAVADRSQAAHDQALFDMGHKYADVVPLADVVAQLERVRQSTPA